MATEAWFAPGLYSQTVSKTLDAVSFRLWYSVMSGPSLLLRSHYTRRKAVLLTSLLMAGYSLRREPPPDSDSRICSRNQNRLMKSRYS